MCTHSHTVSIENGIGIKTSYFRSHDLLSNLHFIPFLADPVIPPGAGSLAGLLSNRGEVHQSNYPPRIQPRSFIRFLGIRQHRHNGLITNDIEQMIKVH